MSSSVRPRPVIRAGVSVRLIPPARVRPEVAALAAAWSQLGVGFGVAPSGATPDLERLLIETVRHGRQHARLLIMAAAWLRRFAPMVARHRLAQLALTELGESDRAVLGWLLEEATTPAGPPRAHAPAETPPGTIAPPRKTPRPKAFREVQAVCQPAPRVQPVFRVHERHPALLARLLARRSAAAKRWNLLAERLDPKSDAIRTLGWITARNPTLAIRALLAGDLRASIIAVLLHDAQAGDSELELARRCCASRAAVRDALARLELAGLVKRTQSGRRRAIELVSAA